MTFFAIAVVINIRNWIYYFIKIGEMATGGDCKRQIFVLDFLIGVYISLNIAFVFLEPIYSSLFPDFELNTIIFYYLNGVNYFVISFVYALTGFMILFRLKTNFNSFYLKYGKVLMFATIALSLPLFCRSLSSILRGLNKDIEDWV